MRAIACFAVLATGCQTVQNIKPSTIESAADSAAFRGLVFVTKKFPDKAQAIAKDAAVADQVIRTNIIGPTGIFGGTTGDVARGAFDTAVSQIKLKLSPEAVQGIQLALDILLVEIPLPANPTDKLSSQTKAQLVALFTGMAEGIEAFLAPVPTPPPAPPK